MARGDEDVGRDPVRLRSEADRSERHPVHVVWELTLACNLRCGHCGSRAGRPRPDELSLDEIRAVIDELAELGTREITLIGGEAYMRRDWLDIIRAVSRAGIRCGMQTGGRAFTRAKIEAAVEAGLVSGGVSVDGTEPIHDRLRGVPGSYRQALNAIAEFARAGITPGCNTQINRLSAPVLEEVFDAVYEAGARLWQVQLTVPAGNAADQDDLILQPWQIPETYDTLARLFEKGRRGGFRLFSGNNIGYYGPYEHLWRTMTEEPAYWDGCGAAETGLALEADGAVKGCPSLDRVGYGGGTTRERPLREIWAEMAGTIRPEVTRPAWGYCGTCYYRSVCKSGCTWTADWLLGKPGNNPMCDHRARTLRAAGLRERVERTGAAPGEPFDKGEWRLILETVEGEAVPEGAYPPAPQPRDPSAPMLLCGRCRHYSFAGDEACVACGAELEPEQPADAAAPADVQALLDRLAAIDAEHALRLAAIRSAAAAT
ncbi:MAG: radical SAM protein [Alphaproteobacteria bacterium]|nr:radical SAM protein [Alphaproteobacteria bacterium]MBV9372672.1 radical SAM protein [Alphaproteobacteria bacterium]MBV9900178.1 radical SAM protein [Alphaproteobacteria bacterium]